MTPTLLSLTLLLAMQAMGQQKPATTNCGGLCDDSRYYDLNALYGEEICIDMQHDYACVRRYGRQEQILAAWIEEQHREFMSYCVLNPDRMLNPNLPIYMQISPDCGPIQASISPSHAVSTTPRKPHKKAKKSELIPKFHSENNGKLLWYIDPMSHRRMNCTEDTGCVPATATTPPMR